ncbi:helix-turn-helix transcriptional regulator [Defluviitalea saccharophila]|uniref:Helix-turn-helix transcriptional regulator n=1 Tax=Defluviitalea saccharophila TaxID=879970 RepID=A0ABZ2Y5C1_9FIRM
MFFEFRNRNKTIKELRKNKCYTVKELADKVNLNPSIINRIDSLKLKEVPEPVKSKVLPFLR